MSVMFQGSDTPFYDNIDGLPIGLGTAYFGQPNEDPVTNPKVPYIDAGYSTSTTATQQLNTAGKIPVEIHLSGTYSLAVYDADGVLQISIPEMEECPPGVVSCSSTHLNNTFWDGYILDSGVPELNGVDYADASGNKPAGWEPDESIVLPDSIYLQAKGGWNSSYRPTSLKLRLSGVNNGFGGGISPGVGATVDIVVYDTNLDPIGTGSVVFEDEYDSKRVEIALTFGSFDLHRIQFDMDVYTQGPFINCIEFVE